MSLKSFNPVTPSLRFTTLSDKKELWKGRPCKSLTKGKKSGGGRNNSGRITCRHKGGGHKKLYRIVDFKRNKVDIFATVERIEYDPNRTAHIALIKYDDGELAYIVAPSRVSVGDRLLSSESAEISPGNCLPLSAIPTGTVIHNIELQPGGGAKMARSAGAYAQLLSKSGGFAVIKQRSGELRRVLLTCRATIGSVSNADWQNVKFGKAGRKRWLGIRPTVRGVAMNPVDHPHGGGEGKTSGGRHPVSPWGWKTKGKKTRKNKRTDGFILRKRSK
jgi:large subunit ribosomal protein L2